MASFIGTEGFCQLMVGRFFFEARDTSANLPSMKAWLAKGSDESIDMLILVCAYLNIPTNLQTRVFSMGQIRWHASLKRTGIVYQKT